jgi:hypothetical protein
MDWFCGSIVVTIRIWLSIISGKYNDLGKFEGGPCQKFSLHNFDTYKWWLLTKLGKKIIKKTLNDSQLIVV